MFPPRKQPDLGAASCLQRGLAPALEPPQGRSVPGALVTQTLSLSRLDAAVLCDPSPFWGLGFSCSDLSFPVAPQVRFRKASRQLPSVTLARGCLQPCQNS